MGVGGEGGSAGVIIARNDAQIGVLVSRGAYQYSDTPIV